jgi:hypothetical protein
LSGQSHLRGLASSGKHDHKRRHRAISLPNRQDECSNTVCEHPQFITILKQVKHNLNRSFNFAPKGLWTQR